MEADTDSGCEDDGLGHHRQRGGENGLLADTDKGGQIRVVLPWKIFWCPVQSTPPPPPTLVELLLKHLLVSGLNCGQTASANNPLTNRKYSSTFNQYKLPEFSHVKSKVDTGL